MHCTRFAFSAACAVVVACGALAPPASVESELDAHLDLAIASKVGDNGDIPGYTTVLFYLPERGATLTVSVNSDAPKNHSARQITKAVTVTPEHLYELANA